MMKPGTIRAMRQASQIQSETMRALRHATQLQPETMRAFRHATQLSPETMRAFRHATQLSPETIRAMQRATQIEIPASTIRAMQRATQIDIPPTTIRAIQRTTREVLNPAAIRAMREATGIMVNPDLVRARREAARGYAQVVDAATADAVKRSALELFSTVDAASRETFTDYGKSLFDQVTEAALDDESEDVLTQSESPDVVQWDEVDTQIVYWAMGTAAISILTGALFVAPHLIGPLTCFIGLMDMLFRFAPSGREDS
jgi:hypothetical protein